MSSFNKSVSINEAQSNSRSVGVSRKAPPPVCVLVTRTEDIDYPGSSTKDGYELKAIDSLDDTQITLERVM